MAKKKKKKPVPPEVRFKRKLKKYFKRAVKLAILIAFYFLLLPRLVPSMAPQVENTKNTIVSSANQAKVMMSQAAGSTDQILKSLTQKTKLVDEEGAEALIEDTVENLTRQVKDLPKEQVKRVKREFCSDLIDEALMEASESAAEEAYK